jgi:hypothetical protein
MWQDIRRTGRAALALGLHLVLALVTTAYVWVFGTVWRWFFPQEQPYLLGTVPLRTVLEGGEASVLMVFMIFGVIDAIKIMRDD